MGADIHMYVQYRDKKDIGTSHSWWRGFGDRFGCRDYGMFGILADVRCSTKHQCEVKGIPEFGLSWDCERELYLYIREDSTQNMENTCTLEQAKQWNRKIETDKEGKPYRTVNPDWHSFSWLTIKELEQAFRWYKKEFKQNPDIEYIAMLKAMKALENDGKNEVVVVFWFDN